MIGNQYFTNRYEYIITWVACVIIFWFVFVYKWSVYNQSNSKRELLQGTVFDKLGVPFSVKCSYISFNSGLSSNLLKKDVITITLFSSRRAECMTVYSYHVTYTFQSESIPFSGLEHKELLAQNRCKIWSLSDCNRTLTHNHLVHKRTLYHLAKLPKWLSVR